jgi:DNA-binding MarR family transcriptional regulator
VTRKGQPQALMLHVWVASEVASALLEANLAEDGVDGRFYGTLSLIGVHGPLTPGELAEHSGAPAATVTDRVRRLVDSGDVERVPNPADGRSYRLRLTKKGDAHWRRGWPALRKTNRDIARHLDRPVEEVDEILQELIEAAESAREESITIP